MVNSEHTISQLNGDILLAIRCTDSTLRAFQAAKWMVHRPWAAVIPGQGNRNRERVFA